MKISKAIFYTVMLIIIKLFWAPTMPLLIVLMPMILFTLIYVLVGLWGLYVLTSNSSLANWAKKDMRRQVIEKSKNK